MSRVHKSPSSDDGRPGFGVQVPDAVQTPGLPHRSATQSAPGDGTSMSAPVAGSHMDTMHVPLLPLVVVPEMGVWETPVTGSHESAVQGLPSSMTGEVPGEQEPLWQLSAPLQA